MRVLAILIGLLLAGMSAEAGETGLIEAGEARALSAAGGLTIVDVRTPAEWRAEGVPGGAEAISLNGAGGPQAFLDAILRLVDGNRAQPLALICNTGRRSNAAQAMLQRNGFTQVYNIAEGLHGSDHGAGWKAAGLPMEPCRSC